MELRDYQQAAWDVMRHSFLAGHRRILYHAPTGSGKTATSSAVIKSACSKGNKVLFLANRRELIFQAKETLEKFGIDCGVIMAGEEYNLAKDVQIASMQTYVRRMDREIDLRFNRWWHNASVVIVDEAHGSISPSWQKILQSYDKGVVVIGLTATPCRGDGRGLGEFYDDMVSTAGVSTLIDRGFLVNPRYYAPHTPDLSGIKTRAGDYEKTELGKRVNKPKLIGDIYTNWSMICPDRPTIIFATNVQHSIAIKRKFTDNGIRIAHVDANTPKEVRREALEDLKAGRLQVITNVGILTEGFDFPAASCIALARPTKSLGLYLQMGGRGLRPYEGKPDCIVLDFAGCLEAHGKLEWDREWSLSGKDLAWGRPVDKKVVEKGLLKCKVCHHVFSGTGTCPQCGSEVIRYGKDVETAPGELKEVKEKFTMAEKRIFLGMLKHYVYDKKKNRKMINARYRAMFGVWPDHSIKDVQPILPDEGFLNRMKHEDIKWSKRRTGGGR